MMSTGTIESRGIAVFSTFLDPFDNNSDEEKPHDEYIVFRKYIAQFIGSTIKIQFFG